MEISIENILLRLMAFWMAAFSVFFGYDYVGSLIGSVIAHFSEIGIESFWGFILFCGKTSILFILFLIISFFVAIYVWTCLYVNVIGFRDANREENIVFLCVTALIFFEVFY